MNYIGIGKCSKYNIYILVAIISHFLSEYLFGLNPNNKLTPIRLFSFSPDIYKHTLFKNLISFIGILVGGILLYFLEKKYNVQKKGELSIRKIEKIQKRLLGHKKESIRLALLLIGLLFSLYNIVRDFLSSTLMGVKLWMFEIIYICFLSSKMLKIKVSNHRKIAIIIMIGPLLIIDLISFSLPRTSHDCQKEHCNELTDKNTFDYIKIKYGYYYYIPLIFISSEIITLMKDYSWVKSKSLMDIRSIHPYRILLYIGMVGSLLTIILLIITSTKPCNTYTNVIKYEKYFSYNLKNYNNYSYYYLTSGEKINLSEEICSLNDYNNNTHTLNIYYDSFSLFFNNYKEMNNNNILEIFVILPLYFIFNMIKSFCNIMIIRHLDPNYILIIDNLFCFIRGIIRIIANKGDEQYLTITQFFITELQEFIYIISNMIYIEILELKFCNLDYDLKKNIRQRSIYEYKNSEEEDDEEHNISLGNISVENEEE